MTIAKCMKKYKNEFTIKFDLLMQENLSIWKALQKHFKRKLYTIDLLWYLGAYCIGFIPFDEYQYNLNVHLCAGLVPLAIAIFICIGTENKKYQTEIKKTCFPKLLKIFGENINYTNLNISTTSSLSDFFGIIGKIFRYGLDSILKTKEKNLELSNNKIENYVFENCGLYNHRIEVRTDDDCIYGQYNNVDFIMNETDFGYETRDSKGNTHYHSMFKGVAMKFKMQKQIQAKVLVNTKSLFKYVPAGFEKVNLEYPEFAKKYQVYVKHGISSYDGQIEARYLFNAAFLDRFMQLKTSFNTSNIKLSVEGDTMLLMLGTNRDLFEMNHLLGKIDDICQYETLFNEFASVLSFMDILNLASKTRL